MKSYFNWKLENTIQENTNLKNWCEKHILNENTSSRYSVEVNFRTKIKEMLDGFAKICLGYVSAALKQNGYHIKHVFEESPLRILVSSRNWDDGEWVGIVYFHPDHDGGCFMISKGFYNREARTVSMQSRHKCKGTSAAEITAEMRNIMHELKNTPDKHREKLKGVNLKRGPKS